MYHNLIMSMAERKETPAPRGSYLSLEQLFNQHEGEINPHLGKIVTLRTSEWESEIRKEVNCPQGGSCMDLVNSRKLGEWGNLSSFLVHHVHISQEDGVRGKSSFTETRLRIVHWNSISVDVSSRLVPANLQQMLGVVGL